MNSEKFNTIDESVWNNFLTTFRTNHTEMRRIHEETLLMVQRQQGRQQSGKAPKQLRDAERAKAEADKKDKREKGNDDKGELKIMYQGRNILNLEENLRDSMSFVTHPPAEYEQPQHFESLKTLRHRRQQQRRSCQ